MPAPVCPIRRSAPQPISPQPEVAVESPPIAVNYDSANDQVVEVGSVRDLIKNGAGRPSNGPVTMPQEMVPAKPVLDTINVVETVYHRAGMAEAKSVHNVYSRTLTNADELQPYERNAKATGEWTPIDTGWLNGQVGMLCIKNREGTFTRIPTAEEKAECAKKVLELSYDKGAHSFIVLPGESFRGHPQSMEGLEIRSQHDITRYTVTAFPN